MEKGSILHLLNFVIILKKRRVCNLVNAVRERRARLLYRQRRKYWGAAMGAVSC
jgi:hypothetical protein